MNKQHKAELDALVARIDATLDRVETYVTILDNLVKLYASTQTDENNKG